MDPIIHLLWAAPGKGFRAQHYKVILGPPDQKVSPIDFTLSVQSDSVPLSQGIRQVPQTTGP